MPSNAGSAPIFGVEGEIVTATSSEPAGSGGRDARPTGLAPETVLSLRVPLAAAVSPDGARAVVSVTVCDPAVGVDTAGLWLFDLDTGSSRRLTSAGLDLSPAWADGGSAIVYRGLVDGLPQLLRHPLDEAPAALTDVPRGIAAGPFPSPDGTRVAYTIASGEPRDPAKPHRVTRGLWRLEGVGLLDDAHQAVHVITSGGADAAGGPILDPRGVVVDVGWSPDGTRLFVLSFHEPDADDFRLRTVDVTTGEETIVWQAPFQGYPPAVAWTTAGLVHTDNNPLGMGRKVEVILPSSDGTARRSRPEGWLFGILQPDFPPGPFMDFRLISPPSREALFAPVQVGGSLGIARLDPATGTWTTIVDGPFAAVPLAASGDRLVYARSDLHSPPELWQHTGDGPDRPITGLNHKHFGYNRHFTARHLPVRTLDGRTVDAWFLRPSNGRGPVPTILTCHGGPHAAWGHIFSFDNCLLAAAGYGVLLVNQTGSTGYEPDHAVALHADWGNRDTGDLLAAVEAAIATGEADPDRLGVWGMSAGAFLTAWLTSHTDRFRAAVVESPLLDWPAMMGADVGALFGEWLRARPGTGPAAAHRLADWSPTSHAARTAAPTLVIQHEQDLRTPPANSDLYFALLLANGRAAEMLRMPGTGHQGSFALGSPAVRVAQNEALLDWFTRHL
jgi:acetyl esterase/lipase